MSLNDYRKIRKVNGPKVKVKNPKAFPSTFECLPERLLNRNVVMAAVVQENNKTRVQVLQGAVTSLKKSKTSYLIRARRDASRQITTTSFLSLRNSTLGFLETKNCMLF